MATHDFGTAADCIVNMRRIFSKSFLSILSLGQIFDFFDFFFEMNTFPCDSHRWIDGYTESKFVVKAQAVVRMLLTD